MKTCRFCKQSNYDYNHPAAKSAWVKYSVRHSAHLQCAIQAKGAPFLAELTTWQIEQLPFLEIRNLGIEPAVHAEIAKRRGGSQ